MAYISVLNQVVQEKGYSEIRRETGLELVKATNRVIQDIVELANRIRRHRFGQTLTANDINEALTAVQMPPLLGYHNCYPVYDYVSIGQSHGNEILAVDEPQIKLSDVDKAEFPEYPNQVYFTFHWLSYNGVQPKVPENLTEFPIYSKQPFSTSLEQTELPDQIIQHLDSNVQLSEQLIEFFKNSLNESIIEDPAKFEKIRSELRNSTAVQPLVPLYLRYFISILKQKSTDTFSCQNIYTITLTLLENKMINIESYIQNFTTIALTLLISLGNDEASIVTKIAELLIRIVLLYNDEEFTNKLAENLADFVLSTEPTLRQKISVLIALKCLGLDMLKVHFIPYAQFFLDDLKKIPDEEMNEETMEQSQQLYELTYEIAVQAFNSEEPPFSKELKDLYNSLAQRFGYNSFYLFVQQDQ